MRILTLDNRGIRLDDLPETLEEEVHFAILDNRNTLEPDFYFEPLAFMESFNSAAIVLRIGENEITLPSDWKIAIGDSVTGNDLEILPVTSIYKRNFEAFVYNPLTSFRPEFSHVEMINIYHDLTWFCPRMHSNQLLVIPLTGDDKPPCIFAGRDVSKQNELIKYTELA